MVKEDVKKINAFDYLTLFLYNILVIFEINKKNFQTIIIHIKW